MCTGLVIYGAMAPGTMQPSCDQKSLEQTVLTEDNKRVCVTRRGRAKGDGERKCIQTTPGSVPPCAHFASLEGGATPFSLFLWSAVEKMTTSRSTHL